MKPDLRRLAMIAALLLLAAACTQEPEPQLPQVDVGYTTEGPSAESPPSPDVAAIEAPGRLAVLDDLGNLVTLAPDGTHAVVLAQPVQDEILVRQPTWSPDGDRLAWVRFVVSGNEGNAIVTADPDGAEPAETPMTVIPFYLSWDPTSSHIAYLGSSGNDIELGVADAAGGSHATPLDLGAPLYLSWNPTGEQLLVHVGANRLDRLELDGTTSPVEDRLGTFTAPVWTADGRTFVYVLTTSEGERLVAQEVAADRADDLVRFDGTVVFVVSPDGRHVAYQVGHGLGEVEPLSVIDVKTGSIEEVAPDITPAFFWSPDGSRLLYLFPEILDRVWFRWGVWDGESAFSTARFAPSEVFARDYLSFFEQYAQSMSLWAPDGSAFAYAGSNESGETGVWIQPAREGAEPVRVSDGVFATWSPV